MTTRCRMMTCACLVLLSDAAMANWELVGSNESSYLFADQESIQKNGQTVQMADLIDYKTRQNRNGKDYHSERVTVAYDCDKKTFRNLSATLYPYRMGEGDAVATFAYTGGWEAVPPGSGIALLRNIACGIKPAKPASPGKKHK